MGRERGRVSQSLTPVNVARDEHPYTTFAGESPAHNELSKCPKTTRNLMPVTALSIPGGPITLQTKGRRREIHRSKETGADDRFRTTSIVLQPIAGAIGLKYERALEAC